MFPEYRITMDVSPKSYLTEPIARWLRRRGAVSVTITEDDSKVIAIFATQQDRLGVYEILSGDMTIMFRELQ